MGNFTLGNKLNLRMKKKIVAIIVSQGSVARHFGAHTGGAGASGGCHCLKAHSLTVAGSWDNHAGPLHVARTSPTWWQFQRQESQKTDLGWSFSLSSGLSPTIMGHPILHTFCRKGPCLGEDEVNSTCWWGRNKILAEWMGLKTSFWPWN